MRTVVREVEKEEERMIKNDFVPVRLSSTVLRVETAAILLGGMIVTICGL